MLITESTFALYYSAGYESTVPMMLEKQVVNSTLYAVHNLNFFASLSHIFLREGGHYVVIIKGRETLEFLKLDLLFH